MAPLRTMDRMQSLAVAPEGRSNQHRAFPRLPPFSRRASTSPSYVRKFRALLSLPTKSCSSLFAFTITINARQQH
ncbi:hypothetical protein VTN31DRAFT_6470 [Thermomyces dupontii]|uniref:uncharacterized protein n=1 Tax=Talaromyces thermophilus TaxID=28565 RepID=UPI003743D370